MNSKVAVRPAARRRAHMPSRSSLIATALSRFPDTIRPRVSAVAGEHPYLGDLALSFPGLLAAIATAGGGPACLLARTRIISGLALRHAAEPLGVAWWLRWLPPEAFAGRVPPLPDDDVFGCSMANLVPPETKRLPQWLAIVSDAWRDAGPEFALWAGEHGLNKALAVHRHSRATRHRAAAKPQIPLAAMALHAWYSQSRKGPAGALITDQWHPRVGAKAARELADAWLDRVVLTLLTSRSGTAAPWLPPTACCGFDMVAIRTAREVIEEAAAMRNCLATYGTVLGERSSSLWSVRRAGERVATVELYRCEGRTVPVVADIKGPGNCEADAAVWRAVYLWLAHQPYDMPTDPAPDALVSHADWQVMWLPFWKAMGVKPWLSLAPSQRALWMMSRSL